MPATGCAVGWGSVSAPPLSTPPHVVFPFPILFSSLSSLVPFLLPRLMGEVASCCVLLQTRPGDFVVVLCSFFSNFKHKTCCCTDRAGAGGDYCRERGSPKGEGFEGSAALLAVGKGKVRSVCRECVPGEGAFKHHASGLHTEGRGRKDTEKQKRQGKHSECLQMFATAWSGA